MLVLVLVGVSISVQLTRRSGGRLGFVGLLISQISSYWG